MGRRVCAEWYWYGPQTHLRSLSANTSYCAIHHYLSVILISPWDSTTIFSLSGWGGDDKSYLISNDDCMISERVTDDEHMDNAGAETLFYAACADALEV